MSQQLSKFSLFHCLVVMPTAAIRDLNEILSVLKDFRNDRWEEFGLEAGLYKPTLDNIDKSSGVKTCFRECLSAWLTVADNVKEKGVPTWLRLADIVEELGDGATADNIRSNKGKLTLDVFMIVYINMKINLLRNRKSLFLVPPLLLLLIRTFIVR